MLLMKAGDNDYPSAYSDLGSWYQFGACFEQSWIDSLAMYRKAVDAGHGRAGEALANNYLFGKYGYPRDRTQALYWLIRASVNGEWLAPYRKLYQYLIREDGFMRDWRGIETVPQWRGVRRPAGESAGSVGHR
ncbi:MAG: sel1 repeat family protein [Magnetococcales bacterium]|nr:sel1 repeat family protein [Magnetococcales bacterium]